MNEQNSIFIGLSDSDLVPVYVNVPSKSLADLPSSMFVVGDLGTGQTFNSDEDVD